MKGFLGSVSMGGFWWAWEISRGRWRAEMVSWRSLRPPPAAWRDGVWRMSMRAEARFGTMFGAVPPVMVPMFRVAGVRVGWVKVARVGARCSWRVRRARESLRMALSPRWGWEAWAEVPVAVRVAQREPLVVLTISMEVGSATMAKV